MAGVCGGDGRVSSPPLSKEVVEDIESGVATIIDYYVFFAEKIGREELGLPPIIERPSLKSKGAERC